MDSLEATEQPSTVEDKVVEQKQFCVKQPLCLDAVAEGPRLQLLLAVTMHLEKEAGTVLLSLSSGHFAIVVHLFNFSFLHGSSINMILAP